MSRKFAILISIVVLINSFALTRQGRAQTPARPQEQTDIVRVATTAVQVEAIVTDKSGRRISGLTKADFQLLDEGAAQAVDYFAAIEGSRVLTEGAGKTTAAATSDASSPGSPLSRPYRGRHIVMIFDDLNLSADNFLRTRLALTKYINEKLTPDDMFAIVSTSGSLGSMQQFTNDRQRLLSALNRIAFQIPLTSKLNSGRFNMTPAEAIRIDAGDQQTIDRVKMRVQSEELAAPTNTIANEPMGREARVVAPERSDAVESSLRGKAKALVTELNQATRSNLKTLESIFRGMAELPGRKIALFMSEQLLTLGGTTEDASNDLLQLIEIARRSGVSVYALDAAGLHTNSLDASERVSGTGTLIKQATQDMSMSDFEKMGVARALVIGTGGELIANTNNLAAGLDRAVEDSNGYYVVGFRPRALDNKFHRLVVTVKDRPELIVRTRRGYLAVNQETVSGTNTELAAALVSPVPRIDVPLEVVANAVPKGNEQVVITGLHVGRNYLTLPDPAATDQSVAYEVLAWVFAAGRDKPAGVIQRTVTYDLAKDSQARERLKTEGFVYVPAQPFTLPPGLYQIRAVIREKTTGAVGSSYQFFEVPNLADKKAVALSSLVLTSVGQNGFNGIYSFKRGTEVDIRYVVYNLNQISGLAQRVKLLDLDGHVLMDSDLPLTTAGGTPQAAAQGTRINLPQARGRYVLIVSLSDGKGKVDIERRADFVVE